VTTAGCFLSRTDRLLQQKTGDGVPGGRGRALGNHQEPNHHHAVTGDQPAVDFAKHDALGDDENCPDHEREEQVAKNLLPDGAGVKVVKVINAGDGGGDHGEGCHEHHRFVDFRALAPEDARRNKQREQCDVEHWYGHELFRCQWAIHQVRRRDLAGGDAEFQAQRHQADGNHGGGPAERHVQAPVAAGDEERLRQAQQHPQRHGHAVGDDQCLDRRGQRTARIHLAMKVKKLEADNGQHQQQQNGGGIEITFGGWLINVRAHDEVQSD